jgi:hypothetical protein
MGDAGGVDQHWIDSIGGFECNGDVTPTIVCRHLYSAHRRQWDAEQAKKAKRLESN